MLPVGLFRRVILPNCCAAGRVEPEVDGRVERLVGPGAGGQRDVAADPQRVLGRDAREDEVLDTSSGRRAVRLPRPTMPGFSRREPLASRICSAWRVVRRSRTSRLKSTVVAAELSGTIVPPAGRGGRERLARARSAASLRPQPGSGPRARCDRPERLALFRARARPTRSGPWRRGVADRDRRTRPPARRARARPWRCSSSQLGGSCCRSAARAAMNALGVVGAVGEDAELEHAHLGDEPLDLLDLLGGEVRPAAAGRAAGRAG